MVIPSSLLLAFSAVVQRKNISYAAEDLGISQPALSKRIKNLENLLGSVLLLRKRDGVHCTEAGKKLLSYVDSMKALENEIKSEFGVEGIESSGAIIRIAGSASLTYKVAIPNLSSLIKDFNNISFEFSIRGIPQMSQMLRNSEVDYVLMDQRDPNFESIQIGMEKIVAIESSKHTCPHDIFLDADPADDFTIKYIEQIMPNAKIKRRSFFNDEPGILAGVEAGYGIALVHESMIPKNAKLKTIDGSGRITVPAYIHFRKQKFYPSTHQKVLSALTKS